MQTAFPGDVILTLPLLQICKQNLPGSEIDFLLIPATSNLLKNNPYVSEVIEYDKRNNRLRDLFDLTQKLRRKKYDVIISPHRSHRSALVSFLSRPRKSISFDVSSMSFLYDVKVTYLPKLHEIRRNLKLLEPLGITASEIVRPELFRGAEEKSAVDDFFTAAGINAGDRIIGIAPGSVWFTKRFPKEKIVKLIGKLNDESVKVVLVGGKQDEEISKFIQENSVNSNVKNSAGKFSFLESAELISRFDLLMTNDSAPLHIANAVGTKAIAIFGSTIPAFGFYPYGKNDAVVEVNGLKCRPCGIHGRNECPVGTLDCMNKIEEDKIIELMRGRIP